MQHLKKCLKDPFFSQNAHTLPLALFSTYANTYFDKNQAIWNVTINLQHMREIESATMPYKKRDKIDVI
jgi:hypothetical protein